MSDGIHELKWDAKGLIVVVVQDRASGALRMVAYANEEAVRKTIESGYATFFSRSRQEQWVKGETSGNRIHVSEVWADCDGDALVYLGDPHGPSCHTGRESCFFRRLGGESIPSDLNPILPSLFKTLRERQKTDTGKSYTRSLLEAGPPKIGAKVLEEAGEFGDALRDESDERVISEAADVIYHLYVGLLARGLSPDAVSRELGRRFAQSGLEEKASRDR